MADLQFRKGKFPQFFAFNGAAVTKSDTTLLDFTSLYVGTAGDLTVQLQGSSGTLVYKNVADGTFLPIAVKRVLAATTASDIIGHF